MRILFHCHDGESPAVEGLAAYLYRLGHAVDLVFDPGFQQHLHGNLPLLGRLVTEDMLLEKARRFAPDLVAFSTTTNRYSAARNFARRVKETLSAPTIIGGLHASAVPDAIIAEGCFDLVCIGEGEETLADVLTRIERRESVADVPNLMSRGTDGTVRRNAIRPLLLDLDALPLPDRSLFAKYGVLTRTLQVMTGRGCPYACTFCGTTVLSRIYGRGRFTRRRSVSHVMEELRRDTRDYRSRVIEFLDDTFTYDRRWIADFKERYLPEIGLPFRCQTTPRTATDAVLHDLKASGCIHVSMGVQSGDQDLRRDLLNRPATDEAIIDAARRIRRLGLRLSVEFIFGFPGETPRQMTTAYSLTDQIRPNGAEALLYYPFPGTPLAEYCVQHGFLSSEDYAAIVRDGQGSIHKSCLNGHPFEKEARAHAAMLSTYNRAPRLAKRAIRRLLNGQVRALNRLVYPLSLILVNPQVFWEKVSRIPRIIWKTRRELRYGANGRESLATVDNDGRPPAV